MRRNIKQQKQKLISMIELPPLYDESGENSGNRIHQRRSIINELDLIKARVHQIIQNYEASQADGFSEASISISLRTLENLLRQYESYGSSKEKELSAVRNFFSKCIHLAKRLEEAIIAIAMERTSDEFIPKAEEFKSALHDTAQMLWQIKSLNAQMIKNLSDIIDNLKLKLQYGLGYIAKDENLCYGEIINLYTKEAIKCTKLEQNITTINEELNEVKSHNLHLMEQTQADKLKLQETEDSMKELEKIIKELRVEIITFKHQMPTTQQNKEDNIDNQEPNVNDDQDKSQTKPLTSTLSPNETNYENKNVPSKASLEIKKQVAKNHTSKLLDLQLNYAEELMMEGQKCIVTSEKQLSDLAHTTYDVLQQKYQEEYTCLYDSVEAIMNLLGSQGSEKLTTALGSAAPENLLAAQIDQPANIHDIITIMNTAVSQVMLEIKLFIKMKRKLAPPSKTDSKTQKKVTEVRKWLAQKLNMINGEISESIEFYEFDKKEIKKSQAIYLDQLSKKLGNNCQKLSKTMEKLEIPDQIKIKTTLGKISTAVAELKKKPTNALLLQVRKPSDPATTDQDKNESVDIITNTMPAIDEIRKNAADHLKAKHNVTISSTSWRAKADKKPKLLLKKKKDIGKTLTRKHLLPTLATCVDYSGHRTAMKIPSKAASKIFTRPKTYSFLHHINSQNQASTQLFPTIKKETKLTITGRK